ncbi:MAG: tRNA preQ1(34) S-adenosylmethionine ribosyltransferase-isomerase QueA [Haliangiales bacterium]
MRLRSDYHYELPPEQIAQRPAAERDASRLLVLDRAGALSDRRFPDLIELVPPDAVVVVNDTQVLPARLRARKASGGAVELLFLEQEAALAEAQGVGSGAASELPPGREYWRCMAKSSKPLRPGAALSVEGGAAGEQVLVVRGRGGDGTVLVAVDGSAQALLARAGELPLPPYIARSEGPTAGDAERYQTVFARVPGAVAAPTAGLHFTTEMMAALRARGCAIAPITLHVGPGTFAPVRAERIDDHAMHVERYEISAETAALVSSGRPVVAIGTTSVRALESAALAAAAQGAQGVAVGPGQTQLFISPGFRFRVVDWLVTNFHLPESTLLMLVCGFAGYGPVMRAYQHAVAAGYRFFSYGDAMLIEGVGAGLDERGRAGQREGTDLMNTANPSAEPGGRP